MFIPRHLICESLRDGVLHTCLGALRWIFYILSEVSTSCCARRDSCARCSCLSSIFAGVGAEDGFFYITLKSMFSRIANHCQSHRTMYIGSTFPDLELLQPCFFFGVFFRSHQVHSYLSRKSSSFHMFLRPVSHCSTKSHNKQNLMLMLHFRHLMHAKYSPDPSLIFQSRSSFPRCCNGLLRHQRLAKHIACYAHFPPILSFLSFSSFFQDLQSRGLYMRNWLAASRSTSNLNSK